MSDQKITISLKEYLMMKDDILFLQCLQEAGVDNWEGYSDAYQLYLEQTENEEEELDEDEFDE